MLWESVSYFQAPSDSLMIYDLQREVVVEAEQSAAALHGYSREQFIGLPPSSFMRPDSLQQLQAYIRAAQPGDGFEALAIHTRQNGVPLTVKLRGMVLTFQDRPCLLVLVREVNKDSQNEGALQPPSDIQTNEQAALLEIAQTLASELNLKPGLILEQLTALYAQVQTRAALKERQRLAQNLHDAVNQSLFSASLIAEVLPRLWQRNPDEVQESLEDLRRLTRGALAEMRGLLVELHPLVLTDSELDDLLRSLGNALTGRMNIPVTITVAGREHAEQKTLPADVQVAFYRLCQESLNNIAKHSAASQVAIQLQYADRTVTLSIHDNGRGFDPEHIQPGHYGLSMMQERAKAVGAILTIASQPGQGTEITIRWRETPEEKAS